MTRPTFGYIDASDPTDMPYAVDTQGRHYMILWYDVHMGITEEEARAIGALPISERFVGQDARIPVAYLHAWTASAEPWSIS